MQFQSSNSNNAQDEDVRFLFRTTDESLWFDRDGDGSARAILVANLQSGAEVTSADILLV